MNSVVNVDLTTATQSITLQPGEYHIYASVPPCATAMPTATTPVNYCQNAVAVPLTATGTNLLWYTTATGGTGTATAPTPSTTVVGNITYYVSQTQSCGESPRAAIVVNVNAIPGAPAVTSSVTYCQNTTAVALTATGTNLLWYTSATGGTGSATAPTPSTTTAGSTSYYVTQTTTGCESPRATIAVIINATPAAPVVNSTVAYCQNAVAVPLTATGTNLLWYTAATGGTGSGTAPTPSTAAAGSTNYYVTQTATGCESPRALITVNVTAIPAAPVVTSPVTYCQNAVAVALTATGTNLLWYTVATGGTGTATAPIPQTATAGTTTYYVSQSNTCGTSTRASVNVIVNPAPAAPTGLTVTNITITTATLNWTAINGVYYTVEYQLPAASVWSNAATGITTGTVNISNLTISTTYDWRVSANCAATSINNYTTAQFTTSSHNNGIANLKDGYGIKISPNPLIDKAIIDYIVAGSGAVTIDITDVFGQRVQTLYNGNQNQGQYQLIINSQLKTLSAGVYFIRLQQNGKGNYTRFLKL